MLPRHLSRATNFCQRYVRHPIIRLIYSLNNDLQVATLRYISRHSSVPVPEIYEWNATNSSESNPVEAEYMIMQKVSPGVSLHGNNSQYAV